MPRKSLGDYVVDPEEEKAKAKAKREKAAQSKKKILSKPNEVQKTINQLTDAINNILFEDKNKLKLLGELGAGDTEDAPGKYFTCTRCGKLLPRNQFYMSTEVGVNSGVTCICKACALDIACPVKNGVRQEPTRETVRQALEYLRKPFIENVWDASISELNDASGNKQYASVWATYIKNISMANYYGLTYENSDIYDGTSTTSIDYAPMSRDSEILETFEKNKNDTLRLLGYLPFEKEKPEDQPFLYAQLIGFLDSSEDQNDDMMRTSSIISIVRGFLQQNQIDDMIAQLIQDPRHTQQNVATIKSLQAMKADITRTITQLAKESCISLKNTRNAKKGENTWTGKLKKIRDINLREGEINGFDLNTCKGMAQVMDLSDASIMKQLRLDESEWSDMVADQRAMIRDLQNKLDFYSEAARIILRENIDLRDTLAAYGIHIEDQLVNLEDLYSPFVGESADSDTHAYLEDNAEEFGYDDDSEETEDEEDENGEDISKDVGDDLDDDVDEDLELGEDSDENVNGLDFNDLGWLNNDYIFIDADVVDDSDASPEEGDADG